MRINTNISSLYSYNALTSTTNALQGVIAKLSTGLRVNSAADDAAGLAISEKMRAQFRGLDQATNNAQDAISMIQTAEGALNETHSILQRMRELSVQSANDTLTAEDRSYIQLEIDQLSDEIDRISTTTQFNKKQLLDGSAAAMWSTSDLSTRAIIRGGLRAVDQFGQKSSVEGNYKITVKADPGQGQIQKTNIMNIRSKGTLSNVRISSEYGITPISVSDDTPPGNWRIGLYASQTVTGNDVTGAQQMAAIGVGYPSNIAGNTVFSRLSAGGRFDIIDNPRPGWYPDEFNMGSVFYNGWGFEHVEVDGVPVNASIVMTVTAVDTVANTVTLDVQAMGMTVNGDTVTFAGGTITLTEAGLAEGDYSSMGFKVVDGGGAFALNPLGDDGSAEHFSVGSKATIAVIPNDKKYLGLFARTVIDTEDWGVEWVSVPDPLCGFYGGMFAIDPDEVVDKEIDFSAYTINASTGQEFVTSVRLAFDKNILVKDYDDHGKWPPFENTGEPTNGALAASFDVLPPNTTARLDSRLRDVDVFYDANGVFMLRDPQTITLTLGSGEQTNVTIYADDTIDQLRRKLNDAIASGLGQGKVIQDNLDNFVTYNEQQHRIAKFQQVLNVGDPPSTRYEYWENLPGHVNTPDAVIGTFVLRSVVPGREGELSLSGDERFMQALGLNVIQASQESRYTLSVADAHSGNMVASGVQVTGNRMVGVLHDNVDVVFDSMANTEVSWNEQMRQYVLSASTGVYETIVHLSDNTTTYQIGANEYEDMSVDIGDMSSDALGVRGLIVTDRESAARSITRIDDAINKVSLQRAKLGAYQNRLEHTISNLTTASTNMKSSESRIRDVDMAKEMMRFTRLNILMQAGSSMLSQANGLPQNVLALLR